MASQNGVKKAGFAFPASAAAASIVGIMGQPAPIEEDEDSDEVSLDDFKPPPQRPVGAPRFHNVSFNQLPEEQLSEEAVLKQQRLAALSRDRDVSFSFKQLGSRRLTDVDSSSDAASSHSSQRSTSAVFSPVDEQMRAIYGDEVLDKVKRPVQTQPILSTTTHSGPDDGARAGFRIGHISPGADHDQEQPPVTPSRARSPSPKRWPEESPRSPRSPGGHGQWRPQSPEPPRWTAKSPEPLEFGPRSPNYGAGMRSPRSAHQQQAGSGAGAGSATASRNKYVDRRRRASNPTPTSPRRLSLSTDRGLGNIDRVPRASQQPKPQRRPSAPVVPAVRASLGSQLNIPFQEESEEGSREEAEKAVTGTAEEDDGQQKQSRSGEWELKRVHRSHTSNGLSQASKKKNFQIQLLAPPNPRQVRPLLSASEHGSSGCSHQCSAVQRLQKARQLFIRPHSCNSALKFIRQHIVIAGINKSTRQLVDCKFGSVFAGRLICLAC